MFKRIKEWFFRIEENRRLLRENANLTERNESLRISLETFSDVNKWHEYYPLDEDMILKWLGCQKPWLAAEKAILTDLVAGGDGGKRDQDMLDGVTEEFYAYWEADNEAGRHSDGRELEGEIHAWELDLD